MAKSTFIVNWQVQGFRNKVHEVGALIAAEAEEVAELVEQGALSLWDRVKGQRVVVAVAVEGDASSEPKQSSEPPAKQPEGSEKDAAV